MNLLFITRIIDIGKDEAAGMELVKIEHSVLGEDGVIHRHWTCGRF
jgi:hypothetical protein